MTTSGAPHMAGENVTGSVAINLTESSGSGIAADKATGLVPTATATPPISPEPAPVCVSGNMLPPVTKIISVNDTQHVQLVLNGVNQVCM